MVAMAIQVILLAGMVYVYGGSRALFTVNQELSRVQENGRYATDMLLYDIRMAGFAGCRNIGDIEPNIIANSPPAFAVVTDSLTVFENGAGWTNPTAIARVAGSDVITLQSTQGAGMQLTGNMAADNANIQVAANPDGLEANDLVLIFDCSKADLFRATGFPRWRHGHHYPWPIAAIPPIACPKPIRAMPRLCPLMPTPILLAQTAMAKPVSTSTHLMTTTLCCWPRASRICS
jgi:hypothetical protein